ncbi:MAG: putative DNA-binding domain-containing protein [Woeseia sp.]
MSRELPELDQIERWMQAIIMDPDGVRSGLRSEAAGNGLPCTEESLEDLVLPSQQLNSVERLSIYGNMYFWRLTEILAEEFPTVQHLLGKKLFGNVVRDYVTRHPSTHYSLARLGSKFPGYLAEEADDFPDRKFAADVAAVERAMEDVFDARRVEPIQFEDLTVIPIDRWGDVRLQTIPALRLLQLNYPVNTFITAVREDRQMDVPGETLGFVAVYRHEYRVWRIDLDEQRFTLLAALQRGESLGSALDLCASSPETDPAGLKDAISDWFREWTSEGLFCRAQLDENK